MSDRSEPTPDPDGPDEAPTGLIPLPRRTRGATSGLSDEGVGDGTDPDGRPFDPVDEETLTRLLSGLRDI